MDIKVTLSQDNSEKWNRDDLKSIQVLLHARNIPTILTFVKPEDIHLCSRDCQVFSARNLKYRCEPKATSKRMVDLY
jgi:hypothetical protein